MNGSRSECAPGYTAIACSVCADGYFEQFGKCVVCPTASGVSVVVILGILALLTTVGGVLFVVRALLPVDVLKLGLSMVQVRACFPLCCLVLCCAALCCSI